MVDSYKWCHESYDRQTGDVYAQIQPVEHWDTGPAVRLMPSTPRKHSIYSKFDISHLNVQ